MGFERTLTRLAWLFVAAAILILLLCIARDASGQGVPAQGPLTNGRAGVLLQQPAPKPDGQQASTFRRLETLTWTPETWTITWTVSKGYDDDKGVYHVTESLDYKIDLNAATMTHKGETRRFSEQEAANVGQVFQAINQYARESTDWWNAGKGEPVGGKKLVAEGK